MNLKFLVPNNDIYNGYVYINPNYWMLKSYYKYKSKFYKDINWLEPVLGLPNSIEDTMQLLINEKVDVLCISVFIWNKKFLYNLCKKAKKEIPNIKIIAGGPDVGATINPNFFKENSFIDYVVYGDGERALKFLLDSFVCQKELDEDAVNILTPSKKFKHEVFDDYSYTKKSVYLDFADEVKNIIKKIGPEKVYLCWEMSRGCPYNCSFCDWNSGLHNKVKRRIINWKEELDFFDELNVHTVYVNDANWGIFKEDIEIHKYAMTKKFYFEAEFLPKLNKKTAYEIMQITYDYKGNINHRVSLQDIHENILKNIDRPEIPWKEHKKLISNFIEKNKDIEIYPELILGLPGQTVDTWIETLVECSEAGFTNIRKMPSFWTMVPMSPGYDKNYQSKHKIVVEDLIHVIKNYESKEEIYNALENGSGGVILSPTVIGTYSCDLSEILTMYGLAYMFNIHKTNKFAKKIPLKKFLNLVKDNLIEECKIQAEKILDHKILAFVPDYKTNYANYEMDFFKNIIKKSLNKNTIVKV